MKLPFRSVQIKHSARRFILRWPHLLRFMLCVSLTVSWCASGAPIPGLFNTGVGANGVPVASDSVDPHWRLIQSADTNFPGPNAIVVNDAGFPIPPWLTNGPNSKWIAPQASQAVGNAAGDYKYRLTFDLTGLKPSTAIITGSWTSDNLGPDVLLNGVSTGFSSDGIFSTLGNSFTITNGFIEGTNTLDFVINNAGPGTNPTGFRAEISGTANFAAPPNAAAYTFTTLAGYAGQGSADGVASAAQFFSPKGIAVDSTGNLYVTDSFNTTIRKITTAGVVSTIAGAVRTYGTADGVGGAARFYSPAGIAVDTNGTIYVTDSSANVVRKIMPSGTNWVVSTIAGSFGYLGPDDGTNSSARFYGPDGIVADRLGNLYVADTFNYVIRKLTPVGTNWVVKTIAGLPRTYGHVDGTNSAAQFAHPEGIGVDSAGNLYVADDATIRKVAPVGTNWVVSTIAGPSAGFGYGSADGTNGTARFHFPGGIAVDSAGKVFVADSANATIRKLTPSGNDWIVSTLAGIAGNRGTADGTGTNAQFNYPFGLTVDNAGNLYVADESNDEIRKVTSAGVVRTVAGSATAGAGSTDGTGSAARFNQPFGTAVDTAGNIYVADAANALVRQITSAGVVSTMAGSVTNPGSADGVGSYARFNYPFDVAVDSGGNVYVADRNNHTIRKITLAGAVSTIAGLATVSGSADGTNSVARFSFPEGLGLDRFGNIFVADSGNATIRKITPVGNNWIVTTIAGVAGSYASSNGTGTNTQFSAPHDVAVDSASNVYVADALTFTVLKVAPVGTNWVVSTIAGFPFQNGFADGVGSNARFYNPAGIAVDSAGNIFVADSGGSTIRKLAPVGANWRVSTIGGIGGDTGSTDGSGNAARFYSPQGIAADMAGNVYVADTSNHTIRKGVFTQFGAASAALYTAPSMTGRLTVTLVPPEASGQWRFPWEFGWHNSGYTASNLVAGNYPVEFRNVPGWLAIPLSGPVPLITGAALSITNLYYPTISSGDTNSTPGTLTVYLGSIPPNGAGWRFLGENTPFLPTGYRTNLLPGTYLIEFAFVSGRVKPSSQAVQVNAGSPAFLSVNYLLAATPPANLYLPFPVLANQVNDESIYPFGFNGQLQADTGYGSGVAVQTNVVLTAAHLVFNDQTLSYVSRAHWFFRRDAGVSEPLPQAARGYYVLSGYAAQRTNDLASGYSPDESTPPSRNMDVAALYFLLPVAGGGHGGYLPSDAVPNTWLTSTALKMLVGYPVDGSQFGDASIAPGKMYQTDPQPYPLSIATDPVPGQQQVYTASWFLSYPGNSGGPLYVQLNGSYYPAAVYLGTLFSGAQPYASIVRAIDTNVVNLITLAASQGDSGTNNTGGGVITIIPNQAINGGNPGFVQFVLTPPAAGRAGAGWRLHGDTDYGSAPTYTRGVTSTNTFPEFKPIPGWILPTNRAIAVAPGQVLSFTAFYSVTNPLMVINRAVGIGITGTTGTTYRIEKRSSLTSGTWLPVSTNTINSPGFNLVLPKPPTNPPTTFYRLEWLP